jgi:myo-inositol catabolism protein IolC
MAMGYDRQLYVLPFDHRGTFQKNMFGWSGTLTDEQTAKIAAMKRVIYDGFQAALAGGVREATAGILVDEQFGAEILRDAAQRGYITACPAEKSGQDEFDFEYGDAFARHIEDFRPTFCKVLVRFNPEGDAAMNGRQSGRLKRLSDYLHTPQSEAWYLKSESGRLKRPEDYLHSSGPSRFMFELLVPATPDQLKRFGGNKKDYDRELRPELMARAITELQDAGIEPDVWKIEGIDRREDCARVVAAARREWRDGVRCIVLGRGEDDVKVRQWLEIAAAVPGFIGFAVGRTSFWGPLSDWKDGRIARDAAVREIARRYREWVDIFESTRSASVAVAPRGGGV